MITVIMEQVCKVCKNTCPAADFSVRKWVTTLGEPREGLRKTCYRCQRVIDNASYNAPQSAKRTKRLTYKAENKDKLSAYRKQYYEANKQRWLDRENGWRFSARAQINDKTYRQREDIKAASRRRGRHWRQANKPKILVKARARQEHVKRATPLWADLLAIFKVYEAAARLAAVTGVKHHVDHYYPLQGATVCGLHVANNLRVLTAIENLKKHNRMPD